MISELEEKNEAMSSAEKDAEEFKLDVEKRSNKERIETGEIIHRLNLILKVAQSNQCVYPTSGPIRDRDDLTKNNQRHDSPSESEAPDSNSGDRNHTAQSQTAQPHSSTTDNLNQSDSSLAGASSGDVGYTSDPEMHQYHGTNGGVVDGDGHQLNNIIDDMLVDQPDYGVHQSNTQIDSGDRF